MLGTDTAALLPVYVGLGVVMAVASAAFIRGLYLGEDLFEKYIPGRDYLRHVVGMLGVGIMAVALMRFAGHYYVEGVGYATIMDVLSGTLTSVAFLLLLFLLKLAATSFTLGSGASGGIFSPALFMGATIGAAYGIVLHRLVPAWQIDPAALALAGMAGMVAGATGAALTAIVMIFEMTLNYSVVLPMTLTAAVSYGLRRLILTESIYTMKLTRRGHYVPTALQANAALVHHVSDVTLDPVAVLPAGAPLTAVGKPDDPAPPSHFVLLDADHVTAVLSTDRVRAHAAELAKAHTLADAAAVAGENWVTAAPDNTIFDLLERLQTNHASVAIVLRPETGGAAPHVLGLLTMAHVAQIMAEGMELFED
jgi:CIC family chloride channel protein